MDSPYQEGLGLAECAALRAICRVSALPENSIVTSVGDCRMNSAPPSSTSKPGTPAAWQEERAVKANLPASTASLSFFITSFAHCFRLGLLMSEMRWVGCSWVTPDSSFET